MYNLRRWADPNQRSFTTDDGVAVEVNIEGPHEHVSLSVGGVTLSPELTRTVFDSLMWQYTHTTLTDLLRGED